MRTLARIRHAAGITISLLLAGSAAADDKSAEVRFNRDIRPLLADRCFQCHGPDKARRKADLRLDTEDGAKAAIVPGKPAASPLIQRITSNDPDERMPPAKTGRPLTPKQIELLRQWVEQGAKWEKHWAFIPPERPPVPTSRDMKGSAWIKNPIDAFVFDRLQKEGLAPSPSAPKTTLIRRMTLDLTGLPPTPEEVDVFLKDESPDAVEKLADRLLASPRYGERMAWRWLEAARYADTNGYQTDADRDMWRWRDWVIEAYNRNLPFDRFTIEQLAGDLLPNPTLDQRIATGFNRNHRGNAEGGIIPEEYAVEYVADRVETTATVWLGLTMGCARCHSHKYDPFLQREYYQLFAFFNNVPEKGRAVKFGNSPPYLKAPTREQKKKLADLDARVQEAERRVEARRDDLVRAQAKWEAGANPADLPDWSPNRGMIAHWPLDDRERIAVRDGAPAFAPGRFGQALDLDGTRFADGGDAGDFNFDDRFTLAAWINPRKPDGAIVSRMPEEPQADGYSVHLVKGKLQVHLTKRWLDDALRVETVAPVALNRWSHIAVSYDGSRHAAGVKVYVDGTEAPLTVLLDELNQPFNTKEPFRIGSGGGKSTRFTGLIDDVRVFNRVLDAGEAKVLAVAESAAAILKKPAERRTAAERDKLRAFFLDRLAPRPVREADEALRALREERRAFWAALPTVMVMEEMPTPRDAFVLIRGEYDKKGEKVGPGLPAVFQSPGTAVPGTTNRLDLAKWIVSPTNPLTARVIVNRAWQLHFGTGLVKTVEDFGTQGEYPSHPELLDWLASEFMLPTKPTDGGPWAIPGTPWDLKRLHKLIVTSAMYRQSSRQTPELRARDPDNRLLARFPRYRLSAEMVRDQALFTSGLLVEKLGGPSVKPYQPAGLWMELSGTGDYTPDKGENLYRRSLYTFWKRTVAPPVLATFDATARETCWVRESRTNTPLQALTLLNETAFVEASRMLAQRVMTEAATADARLVLAFRRVTGRPPNAVELQVLRDGLSAHLADFRARPAAAQKLLRVGEAKPDPKLDPVDLAAYAMVCNTLLNLDEVVTKE
jgi:hypothetical protein